MLIDSRVELYVLTMDLFDNHTVDQGMYQQV
jgi:hypothetical protein